MRIDEESAGLILGQLDDDPPAPSRVDVARALTDARRRRRIRRVGGYTAVAGVTALLLVGTSAVAGRWLNPVPSPLGSSRTGPPATAALDAAPPAPTTCALGELPLPDGRKMALVTGADPTGRFLLGRTYPAVNPPGGGMGLHVVIWDRRTPHIVALPGDDQSLTDVNRSGVAVGSGWAGGGTTSYFYRNGTVAKLPGGDGAQVRAIDDAGTIVGTRNDQPVIWRSVDRSPVVLPLPSGVTKGVAIDIDEDGTVIGVVGADLTTQRPYVWLPKGGGHDLALPSGVPPATGKSGGKPSRALTTASVFHISHGWVTGRVNATAVRWNLRTGETQILPDFGTAADNINRFGWQIGINTAGRAQFLADAAPVMLPELAPHQPGGLSNIPTTLSDDGRTIGGQSDDRDGVIHAVVWTCS